MAESEITSSGEEQEPVESKRAKLKNNRKKSIASVESPSVVGKPKRRSSNLPKPIILMPQGFDSIDKSRQVVRSPSNRQFKSGKQTPQAGHKNSKKPSDLKDLKQDSLLKNLDMGGFELVSTAELKRQISMQSKQPQKTEAKVTLPRKSLADKMVKIDSEHFTNGPKVIFNQKATNMGLRRANTEFEGNNQKFNAKLRKASIRSNVTSQDRNRNASSPIREQESSYSRPAIQSSFTGQLSSKNSRFMRHPTMKEQEMNKKEGKEMLNPDDSQRDKLMDESSKGVTVMQSRSDTLQIEGKIQSQLTGSEKAPNISSPTMKRAISHAFEEVSSSQSGSESFDIYDEKNESNQDHSQSKSELKHELEVNEDEEHRIDQDQRVDPEIYESSRMQHLLDGRTKVMRACLCHPETRIKQIWELFTAIILVVACFMTPFSLAFESLDKYEDGSVFLFNDGWMATESVVDIVFIFEIIVCFNSSFFDQQLNDYETNRKRIACRYLKGWFWVDCCAILPRFLRSLENQDENNAFIRALAFLKIARIGRLIKLLRLMKIFKTLKQKDKMKSLIQTKMRMSVAKERLLIFSVFAILFVHTIACLWIMLAVSDDNVVNWIDTFGYDHDQMGSMYTIGVYWTITTITTVGYGDISATNTTERIVACIIMVIGVIAFSFSTGSLSSIISNADSRQAAYRQKLDVLAQLRMQYDINDALYMELNAFINFQSEQRHEERENFINELPFRLKYRLSELLYKEYKKKIYFLQQVQGNSSFIAWLCPNLKPLEVIKDALIQVEQEKLTCISFIKEGEAAYVSERFGNAPYLICSEGDHFGVLDIVFRLREFKKLSQRRKQERRIRKIERYGAENDSFSSSSSSSDEEDFAVINQKIRCKFTIRATKTCYLLQMDKQALEKMRTEFPEVWGGLMQSEFIICLQAIKRKARMIRTLERKQRHDFSLEEELDGAEDEDLQDSQNESIRENDVSPSSSKKMDEVYGIQISRIDSTPVAEISPEKAQAQSKASCGAFISKEQSSVASSTGTKAQTQQRRQSKLQADKEPLTMKQLRGMRCIKEESETSSSFSRQSSQEGTPANDGADKDENFKMFEQMVEGKFQKFGTARDSTFSLKDLNRGRAQSMQVKQNNSAFTYSSPEQKSKQAMLQNTAGKRQPLTETKTMHLEEKSPSARQDMEEVKEQQHSQLSLNVPSRRASFSESSSENETQKEKSDCQSVHSAAKSVASSASRRRNAAALPALPAPPHAMLPRRKSFHAGTNKMNKAHSRFEKVLDQDELMVMEGFDNDVRNEAVIQKRVKGLTKKSKKDYLSTKVTDDAIMRALSTSPRQLMSRRMSKIPTKGNCLDDQDPSQNQNQNDDLDAFLLEDQSKEFRAPTKDSLPVIDTIDVFDRQISTKSAKGMLKVAKALQLTQNKPNTSTNERRRSSYSKAKSNLPGQASSSLELHKASKASRANRLDEITKFQQLIVQKVSQLQTEVNQVKSHQNKILKQTNTITSGHQAIIGQLSSSQKSNFSASEKISGRLSSKTGQPSNRHSMQIEVQKLDQSVFCDTKGARGIVRVSSFSDGQTSSKLSRTRSRSRNEKNSCSSKIEDNFYNSNKSDREDLDARSLRKIDQQQQLQQ